MKKGTAHLLHGFVGAGKTTFAKRLEQAIPAVRFTHDEWMHQLYGPNPPSEHFDVLYSRIEEAIWQQALRVLELGRDAILDFGFWSRESRAQARDRVASAGVRAVLYRVHCSDAEMERRVLARSQDLPPDALWIDHAAVQLFRRRFEPLVPGESRIEIDGTRTQDIRKILARAGPGTEGVIDP